jgi:hypothetical protein
MLSISDCKEAEKDDPDGYRLTKTQNPKEVKGSYNYPGTYTLIIKQF